jgi:hypothetical protein
MAGGSGDAELACREVEAHPKKVSCRTKASTNGGPAAEPASAILIARALAHAYRISHLATNTLGRAPTISQSDTE